MRFLTIPVLVGVLAGGGQLHARTVKSVLRWETGGINLLKPDGWQRFGQGFVRQGDVFACANGSDAKAVRGLYQHVTLDQRAPLPILATAASRAEAVGGAKDSDYSLYLDITYTDGDHLWGQSQPFDVGTHDWQTVRVRVMPEKPVKQVSLYLLFRGHAGTALFKDAVLVQAESVPGAHTFDGVPVAGSPPFSGFALRDVADGSDFVSFEEGQALGIRLNVETIQQAGATSYRCVLGETTGRERAVTLVYTCPVEGEGLRWLADPRREEPISSSRDYAWLAHGTVLLSRYPFAAVVSRTRGKAIAIDPTHPAVFRVGFSAGSNELYIAFDLGFSPEKPQAELRFCTFEFDPAWGFRSAVARFYEVFPEAFLRRVSRQGIWMPFHRISRVKSWEDFGFAFKEGNEETAWDDQHGILTFRYTEPMTWWMPMPAELPRTMDAALVHAKALAAKGDRSAQALLTSGYHDSNGRFVARLLDTPWCNGAVWSMNSAPGIVGELTDFRNKWNGQIRERLYGPGRQGDLDGEYIDSSEGYVTDELDFRPDHFRAMQTPLTFDPVSHRPCIFRGLIAFEYIRAIAADVHGMGRLMMANATPNRLCWLAPMLDVMGTEDDWNPGGQWRPMSDRELLYRRVMCGTKPYCFLMNTVFDRFPSRLTEKYFLRCLAYGMFPGFFSHNASEGHYFSRPDFYERDRPLFRKYVPLIRRLAEAGWQPITLARSSDEKVYVERFGDRYLTVFNDSSERRTTTIWLVEMIPAVSKDLLHDRIIEWHDGRTQITLDPEDAALISLQ